MKFGFPRSKEDGFWRCEKYTYGRKQNNYEHRTGDWCWFHCNNINFAWRSSFNDCGASKDRGAGRRSGDQAEENDHDKVSEDPKSKNKQGDDLDKQGEDLDNVEQEDRSSEEKPILGEQDCNLHNIEFREWRCLRGD